MKVKKESGEGFEWLVRSSFGGCALLWRRDYAQESRRLDFLEAEQYSEFARDAV